MKVTIICGCIGEDSHTYALSKYLTGLLKDLDIDVTFCDLKESPLPIASPKYYYQPTLNPDKNCQKFVTVVSEANGIVLASPLYHGSFSGVLKNALDTLPYDAFRNKPIGLISHGGSSRTCLQPCEQLRTVRNLYGYALQTQLGTTDSDYIANANKYELVNKSIKNRCHRFVVEMLHLSKNLHDVPELEL